MLSQSRALQGCSCSGRLPASPFAVVARAAHASSRPRAVSLVTRAKKEAVQEVPDASYSFIGQRQDFFRALPLYAGGVGIVGVLVNRIVAGVAPVVDASSGQSRADVLGIFMSAVLLLTGLQWLSLKPREMQPEPLDGSEVQWVDKELERKAPEVAEEMNWAWESLKACTRTKALVVIYGGKNIFHAGFIGEGQRPGNAKPGEVCKQAMSSGQGNYLANLLLYPGRPEFMKFLPEGTQGVAVQPIGSAGVLIAATDTIRGISRLDQAWMASIADKLEVSLEKSKVPSTTPKGFA